MYSQINSPPILNDTLVRLIRLALILDKRAKSAYIQLAGHIMRLYLARSQVNDARLIVGQRSAQRLVRILVRPVLIGDKRGKTGAAQLCGAVIAHVRSHVVLGLELVYEKSAYLCGGRGHVLQRVQVIRRQVGSREQMLHHTGTREQTIARVFVNGAQSGDHARQIGGKNDCVPADKRRDHARVQIGHVIHLKLIAQTAYPDVLRGLVRHHAIHVARVYERELTHDHALAATGRTAREHDDGRVVRVNHRIL